MDWQVAMNPGKRWALGKQSYWGSLLDKAELIKARLSAKGEQPLRAIKCKCGLTNLGYRVLDKNAAQWSRCSP